MAAIAELPVPNGGAVAALPVPGNVVTPEQLDNQSFRATAGPLRRGLRSGANSVGAMANNLVGGIAETMGLSEFAADRFAAAEDYALKAEQVGPSIRDYRQVKDLSDLTEFVAGHAGSGIATSAPILATAIGLRRPIAGVAAPSAALEAGEQVGTLRNDPTVMTTTTPGERLTNAAAKGAVGGALETVGAIGQAARILSAPGKAAKQGLGKAVAKGAAGEAVTEGAQDLTGQVMHQQLNPNVEIDPEQALNSALAGASGGGVITGGAQATSKIPGMVANSVQELRTRLNRDTPPPDPFAPTPDMLDPNTPVDKVLDGLAKSEESFRQWWDGVKQDPRYDKLRSIDPTDPDQLEGLVEGLKRGYRESKFKPMVDQAVERLRYAAEQGREAMKKSEFGGNRDEDELSLKVLNREKITLPTRDKRKADFLVKNGYKESAPNVWEPLFKRSEVRTRADEQVEQAVLAALPIDVLETATPEQIRELATHVKALALNPDATRDSATARVLRKVMGPRFRELIEDAIDNVYSSEASAQKAKDSFKAAFKTADDIEGLRTERARDIIRANLRPSYAQKPEFAKVVDEELVPQMLDFLEAEGKTPEGFDEAMREAFGENVPTVLDQLEEVREERPITSDRAFEAAERAPTSEELDEGTTAESAAAGMVADPRSDVRFGRERKVETPEQMDRFKKEAEDLEAEYGGRKNIAVRVEPVEGKPFTYTLEFDVVDQAGLSDEEMNQIRVPANYGRSGFQNGAMTVMMSDGTQRKVSLRRLTSIMMKREGQQTQQTGARYVADMFNRGMSALVSTEGVKDVKVERAEDGSWEIPAGTPVASYGGETWTYGQIKRVGFLRNKVLTELRKNYREAVKAVGKPQWDRGTKDNPKTPKPLNKSAEAVQDINKFFDSYRDIREQVGAMEDEALAQLGDGESLEEALAPLNSLLATSETFAEQQFAKASIARVEAENERMQMTDDPKDQGGVVDTTRIGVGQVERRGKFEEDTGRPIGEGGSPSVVNRRPKPSDREVADFRSLVEEVDRLTDGATAGPKKPRGSRITPQMQAEAIRQRNATLAAQGTPNQFLDARRNDIFLGYKDTDVVWAVRMPADETEGGDIVALYRDAEQAQERAEVVGGNVEQNTIANLKKEDARPKLNAQNIGEGEVTAEQEAEVRAYVERVLGKDKTRVLFEKFESAGGFAKLKGVETLIISTDAIDPMSVARHEALHALFARLMKADPKAAATLLRAAQSPAVQARLRHLLKDHPKALEQLEDPEEALAYMYQFWSSGEKGLLPIGTQTKTWFDKVKSFLRVVTGLWADEMQSAMDVERAGMILDAFHRGEFADRSAVAEVLQDRLGPDFTKAMDEKWPVLGRFANKFMWTASGAVRDMNIQALTDIMDKFHTTTATSGKGPGWLQAKHQEYYKRLNRVAEAIRGMDAEQQSKVLAELRSGNPRKSHAAREIESVLREVFQYMKAAGVKVVSGYDKNGDPTYREIREIENFYFPRAYDHELIREDRKGFVELLQKYNVENPEIVWLNMAIAPASAAPTNDMMPGVTLFTPNTNERVLANIPHAELAKYEIDDLFGIMSQYLGRAVRRAEYAKRFGNAGEAIAEAIEQARAQGATDEQLRTFSESVKAMEGTLGANMSDGLRSAYSALTTYQNVRLLPLALLSSLVDPLGIAVRGGTMTEAFNAFKRGIGDLFKLNDADDKYYLAKAIGAINVANDAEVVGDMYSSQFMPAFHRNVNEKFFRFNGMESWNRSMRVAAAAAAEQFIIRHVEKPNEHSKRFLEELGLEASDVSITDGKIDLNQKTVQAINMWVDQAIIRPNAANRPVYMSDPNWILISHLKQYTYMFQKTILSRVYHEAKHGNVNPAFVLSGYVPIIIASDMLRMGITPGGSDDRYRASWGFYDWLASGVQRAGIFGPGQMLVDQSTDPTAVLGPSVQQLSDFVKASTATGDVGREVIKAIPGGRFTL